MKTLILLFCKFFQFSKYIGNATNDNPYAYKAMCILSLFLSLNVLTIIGYYKAIIDHSDHILIPEVYEIAIIIIIGVVNYFFFYKDKKYEVIYHEFKKNTPINGARGTWITILYMIITIAMLFSLIWLSRMNIKN